jgi:hypothetical protein
MKIETRRVICTEDILVFRESIRDNYVDKQPDYAESIFKAEYSPFKKLLDTVSPNTTIRLRIMLEIP